MLDINFFHRIRELDYASKSSNPTALFESEEKSLIQDISNQRLAY